MGLQDFKTFYGKYGAKLWLISIFAILGILTFGCIFFPEIFWDKFIYRYYWGPLEVDALESGPIVQSDGYEIDQGYTLVSEITYGIVLILALFGIYRLFERIEIQIDEKLVLSLLPFFLLGGTLRVLEDAELYREPYVYLFISPLIYFVIGALIMGALLYCIFLERRNYPLRTKMILTGLMFASFDVVYVIIYFFNYEGFNYMVHPIVPILFSAVFISKLTFYTQKKGVFKALFALLLFGMFLLTFSIFLIALWPSIEPWKEAYLEAHSLADVTTEPLAGALVLGISLGITLVMLFLVRVLKARYTKAAIFSIPTNSLIIFSQMLDAAATFVGVDFYGYGEKHPIPRFFFETFGTSAVFLPLKFALAIAIVYMIDISFKEELKDYPNLKVLIKIIIIVLGLAPGTRDMVRMVMGV